MTAIHTAICKQVRGVIANDWPDRDRQDNDSDIDFLRELPIGGDQQADKESRIRLVATRKMRTLLKEKHPVKGRANTALE